MKPAVVIPVAIFVLGGLVAAIKSNADANAENGRDIASLGTAVESLDDRVTRSEQRAESAYKVMVDTLRELDDKVDDIANDVTRIRTIQEMDAE